MAFPVATFVPSSVLKGQQNGNLPDSILVTTPGQDDGPDVRLVRNAARAWQALCAAALGHGHILKATGPADSYRPYAVQERIFRQRYTTTPLRGRPTKRWNGAVWYQKPNTAVAAVPGTSNHGWASAVDTGVERDGDPAAESMDQAALAWLVPNAGLFGFSWEVQSEPWHLRYNTGDHIPAAVLDYEENDDDMADSDEILAYVKGINEKIDVQNKSLERMQADLDDIQSRLPAKP